MIPELVAENYKDLIRLYEIIFCDRRGDRLGHIKRAKKMGVVMRTREPRK